MKKYRVTYLPFPQSDAEASDVILYAMDEAAARTQFEQRFPAWSFKEAKQEG